MWNGGVQVDEIRAANLKYDLADAELYKVESVGVVWGAGVEGRCGAVWGGKGLLCAVWSAFGRWIVWGPLTRMCFVHSGLENGMPCPRRGQQVGLQCSPRGPQPTLTALRSEGSKGPGRGGGGGA